MMVIAGDDDIPVQEYRDLSCQFAIYATSSIIAAVDAIRRIYESLRDTGHIGINAPQVASMRAGVEALISLPKYQQAEAETTAREFQQHREH